MVGKVIAVIEVEIYSDASRGERLSVDDAVRSEANT